MEKVFIYKEKRTSENFSSRSKEVDEDGRQNEELHLIGEIPRPKHTLYDFRHNNNRVLYYIIHLASFAIQIIDIQQISPPVSYARICELFSFPQWTISSEGQNEDVYAEDQHVSWGKAAYT